jgi:Ca-activated chloride channel family protein
VLGSKLTSNIEVVAKDVKLQVEFNPKVVGEYRLVGYDNRVLQKQDFNDDTVDAGEIGPDHTVTALYEVVLANSDLAKGLAIESRYQRASQPTPSAATETAQAGEIAFLKVRFKKPHGDVSELLEFPLETAQVRGSVDAASADFRFASVVAAFAELLKGSPYSAGYDFAKIEELAASAVKGSDDPARHEFLELVRSAKGLRR